MKKFAAMTLILSFAVVTVRAEDTPQLPAPVKEHAWLKQLEGEWELESECIVAPGQPALKCKGTETSRNLGGFWTVTEIKADMMGSQMIGIMTIGYDSDKKKYVGTWICNMGEQLFKYEGTLDGQALTLNTEGLNPQTGKPVKMKDVIELKGKDLKVMTSYMLGDDGKWFQFMTITSRRKK